MSAHEPRAWIKKDFRKTYERIMHKPYPKAQVVVTEPRGFGYFSSLGMLIVLSSVFFIYLFNGVFWNKKE